MFSYLSLQVIANWCVLIGVCAVFSAIIISRITTIGILIGFIGIILIVGGMYTSDWATSQRPINITSGSEWNSTTIQNITSLSNNQNWIINGHGSFESAFTLIRQGTTNINGGTGEEYVFYKVMPQGYQIGTLDATNVFVREDENTYPYIEWDYQHIISAVTRFSDDETLVGIRDPRYSGNGVETDTLTETIIHVPNGTIIKDYSLGGSRS
jgi:hypothetical protein